MLERGHASGGGGGGDGGPALFGNQGRGSYAQPGHSAAGGAIHGDDGLAAALLDALGLGSFARLALPFPPDGLDLAAAADPCSDHILVSLGGASAIASPADLAAALLLPLGATLSLAPEYAALFSSAEAIAAVRVFVHDRLLQLGGTGGGQALPAEAVEALQLVEDGRAYAVDWGRFVWAFLRWDVVVGNGRRCSQYLLRLMKCHRPDLFSEFDGRFLGERKKGLILQQQQQETLFHGNSGHGQLMAAEETLLFGQSKNIGKMPASGYVNDQQHRIEPEDQEPDNHDSVAPSLPSFYASRQQVLAHFSSMESAFSERERTLAHARAEIQHMQEKEKEKDNQIAYIVKEIEGELKARFTKIKQLEHDKMAMVKTLHWCKTMLQESSAAFSEYRKMMCEESGGSSLDTVADEKNRVRLMQQQWHAHEIINEIQKRLILKFSASAEQITVLLRKLAGLNNEVQRLKGSRSIPDLNVGPHL